MEDIPLTKTELLNHLTAYRENPDDDAIRLKEKLRSLLLQSPALLYALHDSQHDAELFDEQGQINYSGNWAVYWGDNIRPYLFLPEAQDPVKHYLCCRVEFDETPPRNINEKYCHISFTIYCDLRDAIDSETGIARHDLIASILRENIAWTNRFGTQCKIITDKEYLTNTGYLKRTLTFRLTTFNSTVKTLNGQTKFVRYSGGK